MRQFALESFAEKTKRKSEESSETKERSRSSGPETLVNL